MANEHVAATVATAAAAAAVGAAAATLRRDAPQLAQNA